MKIFSNVFILFAILISVCQGWTQNFQQKSNLPTLYIETENQQSITSKETYLKATLRYVDANGERFYDALGIRGRGNSTWGLAKKPYRIKFDKKQEFLGGDHAKAKSWTLLANYADKSLMRNALAACLGTFAGQPFTASAQFVDLVLNGNYVGNYQISDQMEVRPKRVDIVEQEDPMTDFSNITGGYLLEVDGFADGEPCWFRTSRGVKITIKSPDDEIIDQRQVNYIRNYIQEFENALFGANFTDPDKGYRRYVDENTLLSWYAASEMTANPDAFWSTYIYKNQDDPKIYWGPMWDYDIAFNNCQRQGDMTKRMVLKDGFGADLTGVWLRRMWEDPWFVNAVNEKWESMVAAGLQDHLLKFIDDTEAELKASQALDGRIWPIYKRVYDEYKIFYTYASTVNFLRTFIKDRISFLTENFEKEAAGAVPTPSFELEEDHYYRIHNANTMKCASVASDGISVCGHTFTSGNQGQQWDIVPTADGYYMIINRESGEAITDAASYAGGAYTRGSQLSMTEADESSQRQHWQFVPLPTGGSYVIANRATGLAWNNSQGSSDEGNPFISWSNDADNAGKPNRHWRIIRDEMKPTTTGAGNLNADTPDYIVTYTPSEQTVRFYADGEALLHGDFSIINMGGVTVKSGAIAETIDVSSLPAGVYILTWQIDGYRNSCKLMKP